MRKPMTRLLCAAVGLGCMIAASVHAVSYSWSGAATGNWSDTLKWTPNGDPSTTSDTVLVNATGASYTVTVNAPRKIDALTLNSANATLNASSPLNVWTSATFQSGSLQGHFDFDRNNVAVAISKPGVTLAGATTYHFLRDSNTLNGPVNGMQFDTGGLDANEALLITNVDYVGNGSGSPDPGNAGRCNMTVTSANGYTNSGTITVRTTGYDFGYPSGSQGGVTYAVTNGTLTNNGSLIINNGSLTSYQANAILNANLTNNAGASLTADALLPQFTSMGHVYLPRAAGTYINRGTWTVTGGGGMYITGNGVSFTQDGASAQLSAANSILYLGNTVGVTNTFSLTNGSVQGNFQLHGTNLTLGANRTVVGPTTWTLARTGEDGDPLGPSGVPPFQCYNYVGTVSLDEVRANETLQILNNNLNGWGYRRYASITQTGGFVNKGTISIVDNMSYHDAADRSELIVSGGTLTNQGQITLSDVSADWADGSRLTGQLLNESGASVALSSSTKGQTRLGTAGNAHINRGTMSFTGPRNYIYGASFSNEGSGVIKGTGTADFTNVTGGLQNSGHIAPGASIGTLTIAGNVTLLGGSLLDWELGSTGVGDLLDITGGLNVTGWSAFRLTDTGGLAAGNNYTLINYTGTALTPGAFALLYASGPSGMGYQLLNNTGNTSVDLFILPEPASLALLALAGAALVSRRRR